MGPLQVCFPPVSLFLERNAENTGLTYRAFGDAYVSGGPKSGGHVTVLETVQSSEWSHGGGAAEAA